MSQPEQQRMQPSKVVIERRGFDPIEWSTEDGLRGINVAPFGVVGEFEGKEVRQQMVSWYEISKFTIYDLDFRAEPETGAIALCELCSGTGLIKDGDERCPDCEGFGHVGRT